MTDKEFKRLTRSQLIEIIYQLQLKQDELTADNEKLEEALADRRLRISKAGNMAAAALEIHNVMQAAQDAASHYLEEVQLKVDQEYQQIIDETNVQAEAITKKAQQEAAEILAQAEAVLQNARQEAAEILAQAETIIQNARQEAAAIVALAHIDSTCDDPSFEDILEEFRLDQYSTGEDA